MLAMLWIFRRRQPGQAQPRFPARADRLGGGDVRRPRPAGRREDDRHRGAGALRRRLPGRPTPSRSGTIWTSATVLALGTYAGGWRIIRTLGRKIIDLRPPEGFAAEAVASSVLFTFGIGLGAPISTTHTITSAIMGVGATKKLSAVRWGVAGNIVGAWVLTFPASNTLAVTYCSEGFGGATFNDLIYYAHDILAPYQAKQVLIYCGDNDLASADTITPDMVQRRFVALYNLIKKYQPKAHITFVSIKPSPSRMSLMPKMEKTNWLIKTYLSKRRHTSYVDVYHPMLLPSGKPDPSLFVSDNLHMNAKGYDIWTRSIKPYLLK